MTLPNSNEVVNHSVDPATFADIYAGKAPWEIGRPQGPFAAAADRVSGPVLDAGCGTGEHALFFAARGHRVLGIDFVEEAIRRARAKAAERGLAAQLLVKDALTLGDWGERFASVIDSGTPATAPAAILAAERDAYRALTEQRRVTARRVAAGLKVTPPD